MENPEEVKPPQGGTAEVSPLKSALDVHVEKTPAEKALAQKSRYQRAREKQRQKGLVYDSKVEASEDEAIQILEDRGIKSGHIAQTVYELAVVAAEMLGLTPNKFYFQNGVEYTLASLVAKESRPLPEIEDAWYPGERIRVRDLHALWDFGLSWREQPDGKKISFQEFRNLRRMCITDTFRFGKEILGKDFHPEPHGRWAEELFVKKNPDLLPEVYDQEDIKKALAGQSDIHQRLLISARNSYKSSYNLIDLMSWVLCFGGDLRIAIISSTKPLSAGFLKLFRSYWTLKNPKAPTLFNQFFPEFMIAPDQGKATSFTSPCRQLDLIQPTLSSSSLDTEGQAGERGDIICFEDVAEITNSSTPDQREKTLQKFDMLRELLEPSGFLQVIGTPIASRVGDIPGDLYQTMLEREEEADEKRLLYMICPAWVVKPEIKKEPFDLTLTEDEVDLLFPSRLSFKYLKAKLRESAGQGFRIFRQQSLCQWIPDENSLLKVHFDEEVLRAHLRPASFFASFPVVKNVMTVDTATSVSKFADLSSICFGKIMKKDGDDICVVWDILADRLKTSELAIKIVDMIAKHSPNQVLIEQGPDSDSLYRFMTRNAMLRNVPIPQIIWKTTRSGGTPVRNKLGRIRALEPEIQSDRLWFNSTAGTWVDATFAEFVNCDGLTKSNSHRKDDRIDSIALLQHFMPKRITESGVKNEEQDKAEQEALAAERLRAWGRYIFGNSVEAPRPRPVEPDGPELNPFMRVGGGALRRRD
jgi:hypothetical protein